MKHPKCTPYVFENVISFETKCFCISSLGKQIYTIVLSSYFQMHSTCLWKCPWEYLMLFYDHLQFIWTYVAKSSIEDNSSIDLRWETQLYFYIAKYADQTHSSMGFDWDKNEIIIYPKFGWNESIEFNLFTFHCSYCILILIV